MNRIVVVEYPKSGGTWFVNLLGDATLLPKRDIYVKDGFHLFEINKHPWYENSPSLNLTESCVIKSHELPDSILHDFNAKFIQLVRDGRDVIVSKYFYEKDFCVQNSIYGSFNIPFDEYVEKTSMEWSTFVLAWLKRNIPISRYEELLRDPYAALQRVLALLGIPVSRERIHESIRANTKEKMKEAFDKTFRFNSFVRKGMKGDWQNYFTEHHKKIFKKNAGEALIQLGYEREEHW